jgi:hypothetical protein
MRDESFSPEDPLKKIFHFEAPREKYQCDAAVLWCFDHRFDLGFRKFLKKLGLVNIDPIKIAGGAKLLASPNHDADRRFLIQQVRTSMELHNTRRVILMLHSDCGAYGGLPAFHNDAQAEMKHHEAELQRAAATLRQAFPNLTIQGYFVDFEGVWEVNLENAKLKEETVA